jgi:hypothetical protein
VRCVTEDQALGRARRLRIGRSSSTTDAIDTFISDVSKTSTNIAIAL